MSLRTNVSISPTITASAYSAGYCLGGIQTISNAFRSTTGSSMILSALVTDKGGNAPAITLLLFNALPSGGTYTDRAALVLSSADKAALTASIQFQAANYITPVSGFKVQELSEMFDVIPANASLTLYGLIVVDTAFTPASTSDVSINLGLEMA